jgi:hypothetical protein
VLQAIAFAAERITQLRGRYAGLQQRVEIGFVHAVSRSRAADERRDQGLARNAHGTLEHSGHEAALHRTSYTWAVYRERVLPPSEAQRILAHALELQRAEGGGRELSEEEVGRTLRDLGVDERFVQQALQGGDGFPAETSAKPSAFIGSSTRLVFERRVAHVVDASDHRRLVELIRRVVGDEGQSEVLGDELAWTMRSGRRQQRSLRVTFTPSGEGTRIRVQENLAAVAGGLFGGIVGAIGANALVWSVLGPAVFHVGMWLPALLVSVIVLVWAIVRTSFGAFVNHRRGQLSELLDKVAAEASSGARPAPVRVEAQAFTRIAGDAEAEAPSQDEAPEPATLRRNE